jgi:hypothetical protein
MNLQEVFKKIEMALTPQDETPEVQEEIQEEVKVEMATMKLAGGVVVEAESFEAGQNVFLIGEDDQKVAAPVGEHELEDGRMLIIEEEGVIAEIREAAEEVKEEEPVEEEMAEEEMAYVSKEEFTAAIDEIKAMIQEMGKDKEEMASEEVVEEIKEEVTEVEMSADEAPAAKKVTAAPVDKKPDMIQFSKKANANTLSRVMSKLS